MTSWQVVKVGKRKIQQDHSVEIAVVLRSETTGAVLNTNDCLRLVPRTIPGACSLSPTELQVLKYIADGLTYKQIAHKRERSVSTIRTQLHNIYTKLEVPDRAQAVLKAVEEGWL